MGRRQVDKEKCDNHHRWNLLVVGNNAHLKSSGPFHFSLKSTSYELGQRLFCPKITPALTCVDKCSYQKLSWTVQWTRPQKKYLAPEEKTCLGCPKVTLVIQVSRYKARKLRDPMPTHRHPKSSSAKTPSSVETCWYRWRGEIRSSSHKCVVWSGEGGRAPRESFRCFSPPPPSLRLRIRSWMTMPFYFCKWRGQQVRGRRELLKFLWFLGWWQHTLAPPKFQQGGKIFTFKERDYKND